MKKIIGVCALVCVLTGAAACDRTVSGPNTGNNNHELPPPPAGFVVSDLHALTSAAIAPGATSLTLSAAGQVVYVSAEPGTLPGVVSARIQDSLTGANPTVVPVFDGGFDPVAVPAVSGEQFTLTLIKADGQTTSYGVSVPPRRPPTVVRTNPANGRTDVALTQVVTVVFSEPVDPLSVNASVKLLKSGQLVSSAVSLESNGWAADIVPISPLDPQTTYTLIVGKQVRDLDGDSLLVDDTVTFTTMAVGVSTGLIAFETPGGSVNDDKTIYVISADGTGRRTLFAGQKEAYPVAFEVDVWDRLAWAPDGTKLALEYGGGALFIMNADGSGLAAPNQPGSTDILNGAPAWSPDASRIAFGSFEWYWVDQGTGIYLTPPTIGTCCLRAATTRLTSDNDWWPAWSPDGTKIAFARYDKSYFINPGPDAGSDIFVMRADGSGVTQLTHNGWPISGLAWSPDGSKIAFSANTGGCQPILIMKADGSGISQLTDCAGVDHSPSWSPDGRKIVFERNQNIYILNADGSDPVTLLAEGGVNPAWSPVR